MSDTQHNMLSVIEKPESVVKFSQIFSAIHKVEETQAAQMYAVERFNFEQQLAEKAIGLECTPMSVAGVFLDVISNGLSFSQQVKHIYLMERSVKTGRKNDQNKDIYEKRLVYATSPDGKIYLAQRSGAIEYVTKPVMVYEGDTFKVQTDAQGNQIVIHEATIPRKSAQIIAGYVYTVFRNGKREPFWMVIQDIERLKGYSARQNRKWVNGAWQNGDPNALYSAGPDGQIDTGFFGSKLINFALKNIRKSGRPGTNEVDEEEVFVEPLEPHQHQPQIENQNVEILNTETPF